MLCMLQCLHGQNSFIRWVHWNWLTVEFRLLTGAPLKFRKAQPKLTERGNNERRDLRVWWSMQTENSPPLLGSATQTHSTLTMGKNDHSQVIKQPILFLNILILIKDLQEVPKNSTARSHLPSIQFPTMVTRCSYSPSTNPGS